MMSQFGSTPWAAVAFSPCFHGGLILFYIHITHTRLTCCWTGNISYWVTGFFVLFFGVDWSIIWQQRTWSKWFLLKVLMIYSALLQARGQSCDEYDLSALWTGGTDSLAVKQALKSETVVESREILTKGGGGGRYEVSISCLHHWNSSALVKAAALSRQWIGFKCLCAKASKGNINTP